MSILVVLLVLVLVLAVWGVLPPDRVPAAPSWVGLIIVVLVVILLLQAVGAVDF